MGNTVNTLADTGKEYAYDISVSYALDKKETKLEIGRIVGVIVKHDYDMSNMPVIYMTLNVSLDLYIEILDNQMNGKFILDIQKYIINSQGIKRNYIHSAFTYFVPSNMNDIIYDSVMEDNYSQTYKQIIVGLLDTTTIDKNNINCNGVVKESNNISIVHRYTKHMPMVLDAFTNVERIPQIVLPPISSVSDLLNYLNYKYPFYDTPYRFYIDFDKTYLLSEKGKYINNGEKGYGKIHIDINTSESITKNSSKGIIINDQKKLYYFNVDVLNTKLKVNRYQGKIVNRIANFDAKNSKFQSTDINVELGEKDPVLLTYETSENLKSINQYKKEIENRSVVLQISKCDLDCSIITPNKEYIVNNYKYNSRYDGHYILSNKTEFFSPSNGMFILTTQLKFRRVGD